ncbi:hypothetical protein Pcinc_006388 [Petrolisthes cinctipes]|uniref:Mutator-like transposase domain-containing protein n=1 Tax=Petrolisthes cinctipes TaxID=88211 RepID=A0AAE1GD58_PETCI|nr:hypothetical protein Pcinc_006388 [Petrolisthes cinctipes]
MPNAKKKKLYVLCKENKPESAVVVDEEYVIQRKNDSEEVMTQFACGKCLVGEIKISFEQRDLDCKIDVVCDECGNDELNDSEVTDDAPVNNTTVYSNMENGYDDMNRFLGNMSMGPIEDEYYHYAAVVTDTVSVKAASVLQSSINDVKKRYSQQLKVAPDKDGVYNIRVFFDWSFYKEGPKKMFAIGVVIDAETGLVIDYETVSRYCEQCTKKRNALTTDTINKNEFDAWFTQHKDECMKNYAGNTTGMETAAAMKLFGRSLDRKLRYKVFISDGDNTTYHALCRMNGGEGPYGNVKVEKEQVMCDYNVGYKESNVVTLLGFPNSPTTITNTHLELTHSKRQMLTNKRKRKRDELVVNGADHT